MGPSQVGFEKINYHIPVLYFKFISLLRHKVIIKASHISQMMINLAILVNEIHLARCHTGNENYLDIRIQQ